MLELKKKSLNSNAQSLTVALSSFLMIIPSQLSAFAAYYKI